MHMQGSFHYQGLDGDPVEVPFEARTLEGFREWMSGREDQPGQVCFVQGHVYLEMSQDQRTHGPVSTEVSIVLATLARELETGRYFTPPSWVTCAPAELSTEPDGFYARYDTLRSGRLAINPERRIELVGVPDFVLEIVSKSSVKKDRRLLRDAYAAAGVGEYWLIDARREDRPPRFELLVLRDGAYEEITPDADGWRASPTWQRSFRLRRVVDPAGLPDFRLDVRA